MAVLHRSPRHAEATDASDVRARQEGVVDDRSRRETVLDDRQTTHTSEGLNTALRAVAALAGAVATVFGVVALIRIDWTDGFDSAAVRVADVVFTPKVAVATAVLGLIALAAGAARGRTPKLVVGAVLACVGAAILLAGDSRADWEVESAHGWLALGVGAVLIVAGLLMRNYWVAQRTVRTDGYTR